MLLRGQSGQPNLVLHEIEQAASGTKVLPAACFLALLGGAKTGMLDNELATAYNKVNHK